MAANENRRQKMLMKKRQKDKERKQKAAAQSAMQRRIVPAHELNVNEEANYIIGRAQEHDSRVVSLGDLVLFSTQIGDAWLLDKEDELALCLCIEGVKQPFKIIDTAANFSIQWQFNFKIVGEAFCLIDEYADIRTIIGYPTEAIRKALEAPGKV